MPEEHNRERNENAPLSLRLLLKKIYIFDNKSRSCKQAYGFYEFFEPYSFVYSTCPAAPGERNRKVK